MAAGLVLGETYRSNRKEGKRRDLVADRLEELEGEIRALKGLLGEEGVWSTGLKEVREQ